MLIKLTSLAFNGLSALGIVIEISISKRGLPSFDIVGLPNKVIAESRSRVKTAIINSGYKFPNCKILVNLAPADITKSGSFYDLPIAVGLLSYIENFKLPDAALFFGEVSLDGSVRYSHGAIIAAAFAKDQSISSLYVPTTSLQECFPICGKTAKGVNTLFELVSHLKYNKPLQSSFSIQPKKNLQLDNQVGFSNIVGQPLAKRALQIAMAGAHHVLLIGSPGVGKTLLAKASQALLPSLTLDESIEVTKIYSIAKLLDENRGLITARPFRQPASSSTFSGIFGGNSKSYVGELALAHCGILFLDELHSFNKRILESLRIPLESKEISLTLHNKRVILPANFILISATNPCPCGYLGSAARNCTCTEHEIYLYKNKLSGPLLDRVDLIVSMSNSDMRISESATNASSALDTSINLSINNARHIQSVRYKNFAWMTNSDVPQSLLANICSLKSSELLLINNAITKFDLSFRLANKILKVSRTIADLESSPEVKSDHIFEALALRGFT